MYWFKLKDMFSVHTKRINRKNDWQITRARGQIQIPLRNDLVMEKTICCTK